jgi:ribosomal protein S7
MSKIRKNKRLFNYKYQNKSLYFLYKYHNHFFNSLINRGRKLWAFTFFINVKFELKQYECIDPLVSFFIAMSNITPQVLLFPLKSGGIVNEVAMPITIRKQIIFATKWVIKLLKDKYGILNVKDVLTLLYFAIRDKGLGVKKKKEIHELAIKNRFLIKYLK